jgi:hypothetical protein
VYVQLAFWRFRVRVVSVVTQQCVLYVLLSYMSLSRAEKCWVLHRNAFKTIKSTYVHVNASYFCPILTRFQICQQIFIKPPSIKFNWNPSRGSCANTCRRDGQRDRQTDRPTDRETNLIDDFCDYANAPESDLVYKQIWCFIRFLLNDDRQC